MEVKTYSNIESLHFSKAVKHVEGKVAVIVGIDFDDNSHHFSNYPFIFEGLKYDIIGEFKLAARRPKPEKLKSGTMRYDRWFDIVSLKEIRINS